MDRDKSKLLIHFFFMLNLLVPLNSAGQVNYFIEPFIGSKFTRSYFNPGVRMSTNNNKAITTPYYTLTSENFTSPTGFSPIHIGIAVGINNPIKKTKIHFGFFQDESSINGKVSFIGESSFNNYYENYFSNKGGRSLTRFELGIKKTIFDTLPIGKMFLKSDFCFSINYIHAKGNRIEVLTSFGEDSLSIYGDKYLSYEWLDMGYGSKEFWYNSIVPSVGLSTTLYTSKKEILTLNSFFTFFSEWTYATTNLRITVTDRNTNKTETFIHNIYSNANGIYIMFSRKFTIPYKNTEHRYTGYH